MKNKTDAVEGIRRQAKRLKSQLNIQLVDAQDSLSIAFYRCKDWKDLLGRLNQKTIEPNILSLALYDPNSHDLCKLETEVKDISTRLATVRLVSNTKLGLYNLVFFVVTGKKEHFKFIDLYPKHQIEWNESKIGPPGAVLVGRVPISSCISLNLIATRVWQPEVLAPFAFDGTDVALASTNSTSIIWQKPESWVEIAQNHIKEHKEHIDEDDDMPWPDPPNYPKIDLDQAMQRHTRWIASLENFFDWNLPIIDANDPFYIHQKDGWPYLIIGHVTVDTPTNIKIISDGTGTLDEDFIVVNDGLLSVCSWPNEPSEDYLDNLNNHYFSILNEIVLYSSDITKTKARHVAKKIHLIAPPTLEKIRSSQDVKNKPMPGTEHWILQSTHHVDALKVIEKIRKGDIHRYENRYFITFEGACDDVPTYINLHFTVESDAQFLGSNLLPGCQSYTEAGHRKLLISLAPNLFSVLEALKQKELGNALISGRILTKKEG